MKIFVFGNPDLKIDSLPFKIMSGLKKRLPQIEFVVQDPNEEWQTPENLIILDTAIGIREITVFDNLEQFAKVPRVSMHDFDALTNLRYLQKLGKIKTVKIIGVPEKITPSLASDGVAAILIQLSRR